MLKMSKLARTSELKGIYLLKQYEKENPEISPEQKIKNLMKAIDSICDCSSDMQNFDCKAKEDCYHNNV